MNLLPLACVILAGLYAVAEPPPNRIGWHKAVYDDTGKLLPWTAWDDALAREMNDFLECPLDARGYPVQAADARMEEAHQPAEAGVIPRGQVDMEIISCLKYHEYMGNVVIPCSQVGMGIISCLKYYEYTGKSNQPLVERAEKMGDSLLEQALTPDEGAYPRFTRSTKEGAAFGENVIEPDQGGLAGYALLRLYRVTSGKDYYDQALHIADVLVNNMREGDARHAPWPLRVDSISGSHWGELNANMVYILRLFDELLALGNEQYRTPRERLWKWISTYQCAPDDRDSSLWMRFFEDDKGGAYRNAWAPLELARYLLEKREALDSEWKAHAAACIHFSIHHFSRSGPGGVILMGEQDYDSRGLGDFSSTLGAVAALFYAAGVGDEGYKDIAYRNLNWMSYFMGEDGQASGGAEEPVPQESEGLAECFPNIIHNFVDAMLAVPEWSDGPRGSKARPERIGFHKARYDADGKLLPWTSWNDALAREMEWYLNCPLDPHGYPVFVFTTFMNDAYQPYKLDIIPCTQDGMGILSYLKYWEYKERSDPRVLEWARKMGDYLVKETLTPDEGAYPRFTRSTGDNRDFPLKTASQGDAMYGVNVIEPDKGGLAGYALVLLYDATGERAYLDQAVHNADVLVKNMLTGTAARAPWPFRVDAITGQYWGERNGNMVFILRLFDELIARGRTENQAPRDALWAWIKTFQIPSPDARGENLWVDFFEDQTRPNNRTSWAPLEMARYLIEKKEALDPDWKHYAEKLIQFTLRYFSDWQPGGVITMGEQDVDMRAWGGACAKLGGVAALFYAAGGGEHYKEMALRNLTWMMYHIDADGCPTQVTGQHDPLKRGGWQEDCQTDVIHNFMDAIRAVPEWGAPSASKDKAPPSQNSMPPGVQP